LNGGYALLKAEAPTDPDWAKNDYREIHRERRGDEDKDDNLINDISIQRSEEVNDCEL